MLRIKMQFWQSTLVLTIKTIKLATFLANPLTFSAKINNVELHCVPFPTKMQDSVKGGTADGGLQTAEKKNYKIDK